MARVIDQFLAAIRQAIYGRDVREAIASGIEQCYDDSTANAQKADIEAKGAEVLASIPDTYEDLQNDVDDLKSTVHAYSGIGRASNVYIDLDFSVEQNKKIYIELCDMGSATINHCYILWGTNNSENYNVLAELPITKNGDRVVYTFDANYEKLRIRFQKDSGTHTICIIAKYPYLNISSEEIASGSVTEDKIGVGAVTNSKLADNSISGAKLQPGAISNDKILDNAATEEKVSFSQVLMNRSYLNKLGPTLRTNLPFTKDDVTRGVLSAGDDGYIVTTPRDSGSYHYITYNVQNLKTITIQTRVSGSATYPHYVFLTDSNEKILALSPNAGSAGLETYTIELDSFVTDRVSKLYILCYAGSANKEDALPFVKASCIVYTNVVGRTKDCDTLLLNDAWDLSKLAVSELSEYDVLFTILTDTHNTGYGGDVLYNGTYDLTNRLNRLPMIDFCVNLGDLATATAETDKQIAISNLYTAMSLLDNTKVHYAIGNHEKNGKVRTQQDEVDYDQVIKNKELGRIMLRRDDVHYNSSDVKNGDSYYYFDLPAIRVAVLNSYAIKDNAEHEGEGYGFNGQAQIDFLNNVIFNTDKKVLIFAHSFNRWRKSEDGGEITYTKLLNDNMFNAVMNHADQIIALISGHEHKDIKYTVDEYDPNDEHTEVYARVDNGVTKIVPRYIINSSYRNRAQVGMNQITVTIAGVKSTGEMLFKRVGFVSVDPPNSDPNTWHRAAMET